MSTAPTNVVLSKDGVQVTIAMTGLKLTYNKSIIKTTPPATAQNASVSTDKKDTKIVDINKEAEVRYDVDGYIQTDFPDPTTSTDTSDDVMDKLANLKSIFFARGAITMDYFGLTKTVFIDKFDIDYKADSGNGDNTVNIFSVKFTAVEGVDIFG